MHKSFYASGFLYSLKFRQILLLQSPSEADKISSWSMLGGESNEGEDASVTFQRVINKLLNLNLQAKDIYPIYDYFHNSLNKVNFVFYAEIENAPVFNSKISNLFWLTFSDTLKLSFPDHTKQDIVVGERVINLKQRIAQNLQYNYPKNPAL